MYSEQEVKEIVELAVKISGGTASFPFVMEQYRKQTESKDNKFQVGCY